MESDNLHRHIRYDLIAALVVAAAFLIRIWGIPWGLPMILEEATPLMKAYSIWLGAADGTLDLNPHFFNYPSFTIYLQMILQGLAYLAQRLFGAGHDLKTFLMLQKIDPSTLILIGRTTSVVFSSASVWVLYLIVKRITGPIAGIMSAVLLSIFAFDITESRMVQTDIALGFFMILSVLAALRIAERRRVRDYALFGVVLGLATASKYPGLFSAVSLIPAHISLMRRGIGLKGVLLDKKLGLLVLVAAIVFFAASPYCLLDFSSFWNDLSFERDHMEAGHFDSIDAPGRAIGYYFGYVLIPNLGYPLTIFFIAGIVVSFVAYRGSRLGGAGGPVVGPAESGGKGESDNKASEKNRPDPKTADEINRGRTGMVIFSLLPLIYLLIIGSWSMKAARYLVPLAPFAAGLAVMFVHRVAGLFRLTGRTGSVVIWALFAIALVQPAVKGVSAAAAIQDTRWYARQWVHDNVEDNSVIVKEVLTPSFWISAETSSVLNEISGFDQERRDVLIEALSGVRTYDVAEIPLYIMDPDRSGPFYDARLYTEADCIITSSTVMSRYEAKPDRFSRQMRFYGDLKHGWDEAAVFKPGRGVRGPVISIYRKNVDTEEAVSDRLGALDRDWLDGSRADLGELTRVLKPLAKSALRSGKFTLADVLFNSANPDDPEIRYGLAATATLNARYKESLVHIEWLCSRYGLISSKRDRDAGIDEPAGNAVIELKNLLAGLVSMALDDPDLAHGLRTRFTELLALMDEEPPGRGAQSE